MRISDWSSDVCSSDLLPLGFAGIEFQHDDATHSITVKATCSTDYKTGVEMEAMTACSIAALTIYDMCKAADKGIVLEHIRLRYKAGGKSGEWHNDSGPVFCTGRRDRKSTRLNYSHYCAYR